MSSLHSILFRHAIHFVCNIATSVNQKLSATCCLGKIQYYLSLSNSTIFPQITLNCSEVTLRVRADCCMQTEQRSQHDEPLICSLSYKLMSHRMYVLVCICVSFDILFHSITA
jgi:hypothetical protein